MVSNSSKEMTEVKVPSPGESVLTVTLAAWLVSDGDYVEKNQEIAEIDSDKATLSISAEVSGVINILVEAGDQAGVGDIIARIAPGEQKEAGKRSEQEQEPEAEKGPSSSEEEDKALQVSDAMKKEVGDSPGAEKSDLKTTPLAKAYMQAEGLTEKDIIELLKQQRIKKSDLVQLKEGSRHDSSEAIAGERTEQREKMSSLRIKLSQRLVGVKNETAMLTTFNEVDMSEVLRIRSEMGKRFEEQHSVRLGLMGFFVKAASVALMEHPRVNAFIDKEEIVYHDFVDISIAVSSPKGLVVPVVRNTHRLSFAGIERDIRDLAEKARNNKLTLDEMSGGTFTITNGGVFGSMLSTPLINPPQSAILGMHNIVERPVAVNGRVEIKPIMYVALSYDHRIIDGRESVGFLVRIKELLEDPIMMVMKDDPYSHLLGL